MANQHTNNGVPLAHKSDAELVAVLRQWMGVRVHHRVRQEDSRNVVGICDIINELRRRERAPSEQSAMIDLVGEDLWRLSSHLRSLATMQARPASNLPNVGGGTHIAILPSHNVGDRPGIPTSSGSPGTSRSLAAMQARPADNIPTNGVGIQRATLHPHSNGGRPGVQAGSGSPGTSRSLAAMQTRPAYNLPNLGVGTHTGPLHSHRTGGRSGVQGGSGSPGSSQNPHIIGDSPPLQSVRSTGNVQANPRNVSASATTSSGNARGTRVPKSTIFCGIVKPVPEIPNVPLYRKQTTDRSMWRFHCVLCNDVYRDHKSLYNHFSRCVGTFGNPNGARWYDDPSIDVAKIPETLLEPLNR